MFSPRLLPTVESATMVHDMFPDNFDALGDAIALTPEAVDWAIHISHFLPEEADPWPTYLRSLALKGVQTWLEGGDGDLRVHLNDQRPPDDTTSLGVNGFRVGVAVQGSLTTPAVSLARAAISGPTPIHLWVWVEVQEELEMVQIRGGLRADQVAAHVQETQGTAATGPVTVPLSAFNVSPDRMLLYLRHLEPAHLLTPSTAAAAEIAPEAPNETIAPRPLALPQPVLNVGKWLNNQLDAVAEQFAWTLLAPLTPAVAMRSPAQELEVILEEVEPLGLTVPPRARAGYTEQAIAGIPLRIYALTWSLVEGAGPEWSLTLFVGPIPNETLPPGLELRIRDSEGVIAHQQFTTDTAATYLYGQVFGRWDETFWVDLSLPGSPALSLPAFGFDPQPDA
jgi:hypothetical protein